MTALDDGAELPVRVNWMPHWALPEMTLPAPPVDAGTSVPPIMPTPAPTVMPPMTLLVPSTIATPLPWLGIAAEPSRLVPIKLPRIWLPEADKLEDCWMRTPSWAFPAITLRREGVVPPIVLLLPLSISMPLLPL